MCKDAFSGWNHFARLPGVPSGAKVYYRVGDGKNWSNESVVVSPKHGSPASFKVAVIGDYGVDYSENNTAVLNSMALDDNFDFGVHLGDISYANDHLEYETTWTEWFTRNQPMLKRKPYQVLPGNHEVDCRDPICLVQTFNFTAYKYKFQTPGNFSNMFYSFDYLNAHFVAISTETDYPGSPIDLKKKRMGLPQETYVQLEWLENDLANANLPENRAKRPWIIVMGHRPIYSSARDLPPNFQKQVFAFF